MNPAPFCYFATFPLSEYADIYLLLMVAGVPFYAVCAGSGCGSRLVSVVFNGR